MSIEVLLNGRFVPIEEAVVSVDNRGFHFAESVYEVVRVYRGRPFELDRHVRRLQASLEAIGIELGDGLQQFVTQSLELLRRSGLEEASIYYQVTSGEARRIHLAPPNLTPTTFAMVSPASPPPEKLRQEGIKVITIPDSRWAMCYVKTTMLLPNTLAKRRAAEAGCQDALFIRDGFLMESTAGNAFAVFGDTLCTPPKSNYILHGVTREVLLQLADREGIACKEAPIPVDKLYSADELFITGTVSELLPIISVDGRSIGSGRPGPMFSRLLEIYRRYATGE
ncbi:MAG: D-amino acid aminotransferase [Chloroflexota bacterium]|jgi:D-alanine transaminase